MSDSENIVDASKYQNSKICQVCNERFKWRKKWERCWDEVTTCSRRCKLEEKQKKSAIVHIEKQHGKDSVEARGIIFSKEWRKEWKKRIKAERRAQRRGNMDPSFGQKQCDTCAKLKDLLIRCRIDESQRWYMVCGKCWKQYSGGVPDGDAEHPHYTYGGLWKNLHKLK